jgi:hypothetical protein
MKKVFLLLFAFTLVSLSSCQKDESDPYGYFVFWWNEQFSQEAINGGYTSLTFEVEGVYYTQNTSIYHTSAPAYGANGALTGRVMVGVDDSKLVQVIIYDQDMDYIDSFQMLLKAGETHTEEMEP